MSGNSGKSISVSSAMQAAISDYMFAEKISRTEFCKRTGWSQYGKENAHTVSLTTLNRILCGNPRNISKTMAKRLADAVGLTRDEFITGKPLASGSIAEGNGWDVSGKLETGAHVTPNGVSFLVRKVTHAETGTVGRGKFYCVSQFNMPEREQMRWRLTRHEIVGDLTAELDHPHLSSRLAVFSSADELGTGIRRDDPLCLSPGFEFVFFSVLRTVSSLISSTIFSSTSLSASICMVHFAAPSGALLQVRATSCASAAPSRSTSRASVVWCLAEDAGPLPLRALRTRCGVAISRRYPH
ncbi:MAG: transcriptional regulator with XRE-family HTH domain [Planctomycetaceae bacterium]|jgi:transcriptional regulator with XRE-family HTH domain